MNTEYLKKLMNILSVQRPLFHSEADFHHEHAIRLKEDLKPSSLRLERPFLFNQKLRFTLDIFIESEQEKIGIELKFVTSLFKHTNDNEDFWLKSHNNYGGSRFAFLKDLYRLEQLKNTYHKIDKGFAIILTNVKDFYSNNKSEGRYERLYLYEGRNIKSGDEIKFIEPISTKKFTPFILNNGYQFSWNSYGQLTDFKFMILEV